MGGLLLFKSTKTEEDIEDWEQKAENVKRFWKLMKLSSRQGLC